MQPSLLKRIRGVCFSPSPSPCLCMCVCVCARCRTAASRRSRRRRFSSRTCMLAACLTSTLVLRSSSSSSSSFHVSYTSCEHPSVPPSAPPPPVWPLITRWSGAATLLTCLLSSSEDKEPLKTGASKYFHPAVDGSCWKRCGAPAALLVVGRTRT